MIVRVATIDDAEAMARVHWLSSNTAYGRNDDFERRLASAHNALTEEGTRNFVIEADDEVIGILTLGKDELYAIYVHPDWWGSGAGQLLLEEAHRRLAERCDEATLTALEANARARRFYERNGWELVELLTEPHFGGEPTKVVRYRKRLTGV